VRRSTASRTERKREAARRGERENVRARVKKKRAGEFVTLISETSLLPDVGPIDVDGGRVGGIQDFRNRRKNGEGTVIGEPANGEGKKNAQRAMWRVEGKLQDFFLSWLSFFFCYGKREGWGARLPRAERNGRKEDRSGRVARGKRE